MKPIHTFTDRLRTAMDLRGTRAIDLARDTGLSKARISQYTNGIYVPKADAMHKLARALDVSDLWLEGYDVPMERNASTVPNYPAMKESGTLNVFLGVLAFIVLWIVVSKILDMKLIGSIMDKFINIGLIIIVILFQEQIKKFLVELGSKKRWGVFRKIFSRKGDANTTNEWIIPVVYACMSMSKSKTGALIVIEQNVPLENYERTGDRIDAKINTRLIENIFFKNTPLHDGAMIISAGRIRAAACILPVSKRQDLPKSYGLRHRAALGLTEKTDALAIVVSEETGKISIAQGNIIKSVTTNELEHDYLAPVFGIEYKKEDNIKTTK